MNAGTQHSEDQATTRNRHIKSAVGFLCGVTKLLIFLAVLSIVLNWLGDFLHAPLGIKDNPPESSDLVQLAQTLAIPLLALYFVLRLLRWCLDQYTAIEIAISTGLMVLGAFWALWAAQEIFHREFIPGSSHIVRLVFPFLIAAPLLAANLFSAWKVAGWWKDKSVRVRIAIVMIFISTLPAITSFVELCFGNRSMTARYAVLSAVVFFIGINLIPLEKSKKNQTDVELKVPQDLG